MIEIYDIDGTLTYIFGDIPNKTKFNTYAYWYLISEHFTQDINLLNKMTEDWNESIKTESHLAESSHNMMQRGIDTFRNQVTAHDVRCFAKAITLQFIKYGVVRKEAIGYLEKKIKQGMLCILSTGSYQDGALGFVDALIESKLISQKTAKELLISGAIVDWEKRQLLHANVRERKLKGIEMLLGKKIENIKSDIKAVYADDPWINDHGILSIAPPGKGYIIPTHQNKGKVLPNGYVFAMWDSIVNSDIK